MCTCQQIHPRCGADSPLTHLSGLENLLRTRQVTSLFFGKYQPSIGKNVQHTAAAQAQLDLFHTRLTF